MKKSLLTNVLIAIGLFVAAATTLPVLLPQSVAAQAVQEKALCEGSGGRWSGESGGSCSTPGSQRTVPGTIREIVNILIFVIGAVSIIMIVIGGLRYTLSGGDEKAVSAAKNTVIYAVIGLIVTVAAYALVNFVLRGLGVN